ncbi:MAG: cyclic nucleotide-binding domain-containing protein [Desulfobacter sp.]|nr:MAG: cyclic nucleotide-binding domain-containing protein [Desulfobacter sp.]
MVKKLKANLVSDQTINVLRKFMVFDDLSCKEIKKLLLADGDYHARIAKLCQYEAGETVIQEGDFDCWSFWVVKGQFDVIQNHEIVATFSKPGEIFGEMSVLEGIPRTASVVSKTRGICLCMDMSVTENLEDGHLVETIKKGFYRVILTRLNRTRDKMQREKEQIETKYSDLLSFENRIRGKA